MRKTSVALAGLIVLGAAVLTAWSVPQGEDPAVPARSHREGGGRRGPQRRDRVTAVFLAVAAVAVSAIVWLGVAIVRQDRAFEVQRLDERREGAADRLVTALERALSADERLLDNLAAPPEGLDGALVFVADSSGLQVWPERSLLYYPAVPPMREALSEVFRETEALEYAGRKYEQAIAILRRLSASRDAAVKAGAELRLARNLRKAGRAEAALEVYGDLRQADQRQPVGGARGPGGAARPLRAARGTGASGAVAHRGAGPRRGPAGRPLATRSRGVALLRRAGPRMAWNEGRGRWRAVGACRGRRLGVAALAGRPDHRAAFVGTALARDRRHARHPPVAHVERPPDGVCRRREVPTATLVRTGDRRARPARHRDCPARRA